MEHEILKIMVEEKAIVRLLATIRSESYHTRELLSILKGWSYGHRTLMRAHNLGLIERERVRPEGKGNWRVYNKLSARGKELVKLAERLGISSFQ